MTVTRAAGTKCSTPDESCPVQSYVYKWDEVGRLTKATRYDGAQLGAELEYAYDSSDSRVRKTAGLRHSVYIFGSLELRSATHSAGEYLVDQTTEVPYLFGHGVRLGRVVYQDAGRRIFLELGDHLGSTAVVLDLETGALVERSTAFAYGAAESHYRSGDWDDFREDYRFTGKEDDIEVGLIYFGARYLNPQLGRWISADPLAVHAPGKADLNLYAYVHGRVLSAVDPVGLQSSNGASGGDPPPANAPSMMPPPQAQKPSAQPPPAPTGPDVGAQGSGNADPHAQAAEQKAEQQKQQTVNTAMQKLPPDMRKAEKLTPLWEGGQVKGWVYRPDPGGHGDPRILDSTGRPGRVIGTAPLQDTVSPGDLLAPGVGRVVSRMIPGRLVLSMPRFSAGAAATTERAAIAPLGRGSTANGVDRWLPGNLSEQLAVEEAMQNPAIGQRAAGPLGDPRWPASDGWVKMQQTIDPGGRAGPMSVHYNYNTGTGAVDDFKLVLRKPYVPPPDPVVPPGSP